MRQIKDIPGYEGLYAVTTTGEVFSYPKGNKKPRWLKSYITSYGYSGLSLTAKQKLVHRLVAIAFIPNPDNKPQINHINGIKTDNHVSNLEWVTNSENVLHSFRVLGKKANKPGLNKFNDNSLRAKKVLQYSMSGEFIAEYGSVITAAKECNCNKISIASCARGIYKSAGNYIWRYK